MPSLADYLLANTSGGNFGTMSPGEEAAAVTPGSVLDALARSAYRLGATPRDAMRTAVQPTGGMVSDVDVARGLLSEADIGKRTGEGALSMMGVGGAFPTEANALNMGIKAYHGSPHDFERFDIGKIGTGEGAQAYGHGLYFAENPEVANQYKNTLAGITTQVERNGPDGKFIAMSYDNAKQKPIARAEFDTLKEANAWTAEQEATAPRGRGYEVDINADPEHFLDYDKPLSEQSPKVQEALQKILPDAQSEALKKSQDALATLQQKYPNSDPMGQQASLQRQIAKLQSDAGLTGEEIRKKLFMQPGANEQSVSQSLREAGIPGIKYLDQGSRGAGAGTSNYVVFDDKLIDILKKYGIAAGLIPAGAAALGKQQQ